MPGKYPGHWQHVNVLVVDDHRVYRLLIGGLLHKLGVPHEVHCDGQAALDAMAGSTFDLVITDCRMPRMDGYTLARELRRREREAGRPRVPVISLTGRLGQQEVRRCLDSGMDGWLIKPITLEQLKEVLMYWLPDPRQRLRKGPITVHERSQETRPTRAGLIAAFGSWGVVQPLLESLLQEAREDLEALEQARVSGDISLTTQRLHRLVGSIAFLGATGLERRAIQLTDRVNLSGVAFNGAALQALCQEVERYLEELAFL